MGNVVDPSKVTGVESGKLARVLKASNAGDERADEAVGIDAGGVVVDARQDGSIGHVGVLSKSEVSDEGAKGETHDSKLVWLAKITSELAILDLLGELDEDSLLVAELVSEAGNPVASC